jgi:hypothetical protein
LGELWMIYLCWDLFGQLDRDLILYSFLSIYIQLLICISAHLYALYFGESRLR